MKHLTRLIAAALFATTALFFTAAHPAYAACLVLQTTYLGEFVDITLYAGHTYDDTWVETGTPFHAIFVQDVTQHYTFNTDVDSETLIDLSCNVSGPVTWFNPGDGRVDPRPGDRLAIYCNPAKAGKPVNVAVLGLINNVGKQLIDPNLADVVGKWQSLSDGMGGSVSIGGSQFSLTVQWFNSTVGATGTGDFTKTVSCNS